MKVGLTYQYHLVARLRERGQIEVKTLGQTGERFAQHHKTTPPTAVVSLVPKPSDARRSIWFNSRFFRVNLVIDDQGLLVRDLHLFRQQYAERYLTALATTDHCHYDTLPVINGFQNNGPPIRTVARVKVGDSLHYAVDDVDVREQDASLSVSVRVNGHVVSMEFTEDSLRLRCDSITCTLECVAHPAVQRPTVRDRSLGFRHNEFDYACTLRRGTCGVLEEGWSMVPESGLLELEMSSS